MATRWLEILRRCEGEDLGAALVRMARRAAQMHAQELDAGGVTPAERRELIEPRASTCSARFDSSVPRPDR